VEVIRFTPAEGLFPLYRTLSSRESQVLRALLGQDFLYPLVDGEPMDELLFDVLAPVNMSAHFFFACPAGAHLLGTFELRDGRARVSEGGGHRSRARTH
jgi:hypothetical protein